MKRLSWLLPLIVLAACSSEPPKKDAKTEAQKAMAGLAQKDDSKKMVADAKTEGEKTKSDAAATEDKAKDIDTAKAAAKDETAGGGSKVVCKHGKDERTIEVAAKDKGC